MLSVTLAPWKLPSPSGEGRWPRNEKGITGCEYEMEVTDRAYGLSRKGLSTGRGSFGGLDAPGSTHGAWRQIRGACKEGGMKRFAVV